MLQHTCFAPLFLLGLIIRDCHDHLSWLQCKRHTGVPFAQTVAALLTARSHKSYQFPKRTGTLYPILLFFSTMLRKTRPTINEAALANNMQS